MPLDGTPEMPTDTDDAALSGASDDAQAATEGAFDSTEDTAPDPAWAAREAELWQQAREAERSQFDRDRANLQQVKDREVTQAQSAAQLYGAENQVIHQWLDTLFQGNEGQPIMLTENDLMKFRWGLRNARDQIASQQAQQFQQTQQQAVGAQQFASGLSQRQTERATELGYGVEGLRQLQAQPTYKQAVAAFEQLGQLHFQNPTDPRIKTAAEAAGATLRTLEEQFAGAYKQQPAIKQSSRNIDKAAARGSQSTTTRAGGATGAVGLGQQLQALQAKALEQYPASPHERQLYYLTEKQKLTAAATKR